MSRLRLDRRVHGPFPPRRRQRYSPRCPVQTLHSVRRSCDSFRVRRHGFTVTLGGGPGSAGVSFIPGVGCLLRSRSSASCFATFAATSAPAPRNLPPLLSWVVDQITSPSRLTNRTAA